MATVVILALGFLQTGVVHAHADGCASGEAGATPDEILATITGHCRDAQGDSDTPMPQSGGSGEPVVVLRASDVFWGHQGGCAEGEFEALFDLYLVYPDGTEVPLDTTYVGCWTPPAPASGSTSSVPLVTATRVHEQVRRRLPTPRLSISPEAGGITGMQTWLWHDHADDGLQPVDSDRDGTPDRLGYRLALDVDGAGVTAVVWPTRYLWEIADCGDRGPEVAETCPDEAGYDAPLPGSEERPAARHTFRTTGTRAITVTVAWTGWWEFRSGGSVTDGGPLGPVPVTSTTPYEVREVVSRPA